MKKTIKRFVKKLNKIYDKFWDIRLGVNTQGIHPSSGTTKFKDSVECNPTSYRLLHKIMKKLRFKNPEVEIFVDYGCGKGRAICMFAQSGFKRIYGVEVSPVWAELAIQNVKKVRRRLTQDIRVINEDAVNFDCSEGTVFYFFNPFGENTFREVLSRIHDSVQTNRRSIHIIYYNTVCKHVFDSATWLEEKQVLHTDSHGNAVIILYKNKVESKRADQEGHKDHQQ